MLRYHEDIRSLVFLIFSILTLLAGVNYGVGAASLYLVPISMIAFYICFTINHNQLHHGIFESVSANTLTNVLLSLCTGIPVTLIYLPHVQNHHPNHCNEKDWAGAHLAKNHQGIWRALIYIARAQIEPMKLRPRSLLAGLSPYRKRSLYLESLALGIYILTALFLNPLSFLVHNLIPWFVSMNALILMNFALHDGCDYQSDLDHSLTFTSKIGNYFLLNNGYHLAHHENPKLHWSKLPQYYLKNVQFKARPDFEKKSILKHLYLRYFFLPKISENKIVSNKT